MCGFLPVGSGKACFCYFNLILLFGILDMIYHQLFLSLVYFLTQTQHL